MRPELGDPHDAPAHGCPACSRILIADLRREGRGSTQHVAGADTGRRPGGQRPEAGALAPTAAQAALQALHADRTRLLNSGRTPARGVRPFDEAAFRKCYAHALDRSLGLFRDRCNVALARDGLREMILGGKTRLRPTSDNRIAGAFELDGVLPLVVLQGLL